MPERAAHDAASWTADTFAPVAQDAVRMCTGPCGELKICTAFPTVSGQPGARYGECRACRDERLRRLSPAEAASGLDTAAAKGFPVGGRRATRWAQRAAVADGVAAAFLDHGGQAVSISQVYEEVCDQLEFVPSEADVRESVRELVKRDERCVKLGRETYAWVQPGEATPPPPAPAHVVEMIERRWRGLTLDEIGAEFGVTRERVRQLLKKHGGPSADEIRALRAAEARSAERAREEAVIATLRDALGGRGPMTVAKLAEVTGLEPNEVAKHWPEDLAHLRLWGTGQGESRWTDEDICEALRQASAYEFPLTAKAYSELVQVGQIIGPSAPRIEQRFRSWSAACEEAGVVPGEPPKNREYESKWSDDDLLQIVRAYLFDPDAPSSVGRFDEWKRANAPDGPSAQTLRNRFGSWTEVKRRALAQRGSTT